MGGGTRYHYFPFPFVGIVFDAARISSRTLTFRGPLSPISNFRSLLLCFPLPLGFLSDSVSDFLWLLPLKKPAIDAGIELCFPNFLLHKLANLLCQSSITGQFTFLDREDNAMRGVQSSELWSCLCTYFPIYLHRELLSWRQVLRPT